MRKTFNSGGFSMVVVYANIIFEDVHFNIEGDIRYRELCLIQKETSIV